MATRKSTPARKAPVHHRRKSGITEIPGAAATVGLVVANMAPIQTVLNNPMDPNNLAAGIKQAVKPNQLLNDGIGVLGGYMAGSLIKKVAPRFIKAPLGKLALKMPKVI